MWLRKHSQLFIAISTLLLTTPLWATNGYITHGIGTKNKSMAGSGLAMPEDAISMANNPAAILANGDKYDAGLAIFSPSRSYSSSESQLNGNFGSFTIGPNDIDSENDLFFIPHFAATWKLNERSAWGVAFYGRGGMNTEWKGGTASFDPDGPEPAPVTTFPGTYGAGAFGGNGTAGVDLSQAFLDVGFSHKSSDILTWGASIVGVAQVFSAKGVGTFAPYTKTLAESGGTVFPDSLSNNGHDQSYGFGGKFGIQMDFSPRFSLAAAYQSEIGMSDLKDYSDLFADGGNFDIPGTVKVGITFRPGNTLALNFDVEHVYYGNIDSIANPMSNLFGCPSAGAGPSGNLENCLGGKNGPGFGWDDMTIYKIGGQWNSGNNWTWRAGYSHGDQPIPDTELLFNILAPATPEDHLTFGFTRGLTSGNEYSIALMYAMNKKVTGLNPLDPTQTISIDMDQWEIEFSFGWR
jgi:long-chain fatty acid transport protein